MMPNNNSCRRRKTSLFFFLGMSLAVAAFVSLRVLTVVVPRHGDVSSMFAMTPPVTSSEYESIRTCVRYSPIRRMNPFKSTIATMDYARFEGLTFLKDTSTVVEVGGYTGSDAERMSKLYRPHYHILEPVPTFFKELQVKFGGNSKFKLYPFGLGLADKKLVVQASKDGTSAFWSGDRKQDTSIEIRNATKFFHELGLPKTSLDLLQINCEGCEYELLEVLLESGLLSSIRTLVFQFHLDLPGVDQEDARYCSILTLLRRTHTPLWQFKHIWQAWTLR